MQTFCFLHFRCQNLLIKTPHSITMWCSRWLLTSVAVSEAAVFRISICSLHVCARSICMHKYTCGGDLKDLRGIERSTTRLSPLLHARRRLCCLRGSIGDAVALILCPQGTADMDKCKLLTWCCLLCSLIKDGVALLSHNLPPNMLKVSAIETTPPPPPFFSFFFLNMPHDKPVAPRWTDMCDDHNKAKLFMTPAMQPLWSGSAVNLYGKRFWDNNARTWSVGKGSAWCSAWFN